MSSIVIIKSNPSSDLSPLVGASLWVPPGYSLSFWTPPPLNDAQTTSRRRKGPLVFFIPSQVTEQEAVGLLH